MPKPVADPLTKRCRAIGCVKIIPSSAIFCGVHYPIIAPKFGSEIPNNKEPATLDDGIARRIITSTRNAVAYIANLEGRSADFKRAEQRGITAQSGGGAGNSGPGNSGGGGGGGNFGTDKFQEL
jgi:uncharacterized membrane protein YgcG